MSRFALALLVSAATAADAAACAMVMPDDRELVAVLAEIDAAAEPVAPVAVQAPVAPPAQLAVPAPAPVPRAEPDRRAVPTAAPPTTARVQS